MKKICKQCGAEFTLTQDEISFYQSKNLHIPKRCEKCRIENRAGGKAGAGMRSVSSQQELTENIFESVKTPGQVYRAYDARRNDKKKAWIAVAVVLLLMAVGIVGFQLTLLPGQNEAATEVQPVQVVVDDVHTTADIDDDVDDQIIVDEPIEEVSVEQPSAAEEVPVSEVEQTPVVAYNFRKPEYLQEHFEKHGAEFGYTSAEEYLAGANRVVASPEALHKLEAEDGDEVYYLESTNEIVFVSTSGYLRTYFKPNDGKAYFDRQ